MTIYIVSAGRSGTGWLCSVLAGCGLSVSHEWTPKEALNPDVVADTSWIWDRDQFLGSLTMHDVVLLIDRDRKDREASVNKLLGVRDWSSVDAAWQEMKKGVLARGGMPLFAVLTFEELFTEKGLTLLEGALCSAKHDTKNLRNMWDFMKHMKVTNNTVEQHVKESYGLS